VIEPPFVTWTGFAVQSLENSPYREHFCPGLECQFQSTEDDDYLDLHGESTDQPFKYRLPKNGHDNPTDNDGPIPFTPQLIVTWGTSWWDYRNKSTVGCFGDIDFGHGSKGRTREEIANWDQKAQQVSYLMNCTSKGGDGRHGVVFLEKPLPAVNRAQHKANCRAIIAQLSDDIGIDLFEFCCSWGAIQYIFSRTHAGNGLRCIKPATSKLILPENWQELVTPFEHASEPQRRILTAESVAHHVKMDDTHRSIGDTSEKHGFLWTVEENRGRVVVHLHTKALEIDHQENNRRGPYSTNAPGRDPKTPNAYAFLKPSGGLAVRRHGDAAEDDNWHQGPSGIWCCDYNVAPTFARACEICGGVKGKKGIIFLNGRAGEVLALLAVNLEIPERLRKHRTDLMRHGQNLLVAIHTANCGEFDGWTFDYGKYERVIEEALPPVVLSKHEDRIRHTTDAQRGKDWTLLDDRGDWKIEPLGAVKTYVKGYGHNDDDVAEVIKHHLERNWLLERIPFAREYSDGKRIWNRDGARYVKLPRKGGWPRCKMILDHLGAALTPLVRQDPWCMKCGITTGSYFLKLWAALMFRRPRQRLPYLFFWSETQNTGKSSFHRMLVRMFANSNGWCELRKELLKDDFNDLLRGCALAYLEEIDLSRSPFAYDLVKGLVDSPILKIRGIYAASEMEVNYVHFIQSANARHHCPIFPNDTRIMVIPVCQYEGRDIAWTEELQPIIDTEAPAFLHELLTMPIPDHGCGRLFLPALETDDKREAMAERAAETAGWYGELMSLATAGKIINLEAKDILRLLVEATNDSKVPKTAQGLGSRLQSLKTRLQRNGFEETWSNDQPARYTIKPLG
jgi:hypothetical protein